MLNISRHSENFISISWSDDFNSKELVMRGILACVLRQTNYISAQAVRPDFDNVNNTKKSILSSQNIRDALISDDWFKLRFVYAWYNDLESFWECFYSIWIDRKSVV